MFVLTRGNPLPAFGVDPESGGNEKAIDRLLAGQNVAHSPLPVPAPADIGTCTVSGRRFACFGATLTCRFTAVDFHRVLTHR
ncbi:hypothetical protein, partial [Burkholderia glumae]|uniref:hypothetical protein n=1 Tax=Burkholderia glumae TaxID=337 RepID=UPI00214A10DD